MSVAVAERETVSLFSAPPRTLVDIPRAKGISNNRGVVLEACPLYPVTFSPGRTSSSRTITVPPVSALVQVPAGVEDSVSAKVQSVDLNRGE